jgi:hypothetical protein
MGLVPIPEFWSKTSHRGTPAHALFLHWIFSVICIVITPLDNPAGFLIMSTLYAYVHAYISSLSLLRCYKVLPMLIILQFFLEWHFCAHAGFNLSKSETKHGSHRARVLDGGYLLRLSSYIFCRTLLSWSFPGGLQIYSLQLIPHNKRSHTTPALLLVLGLLHLAFYGGPGIITSCHTGGTCFGLKKRSIRTKEESWFYEFIFM